MDELLSEANGFRIQFLSFGSNPTNWKFKVILFFERSFGFVGRSFRRDKIIKKTITYRNIY